MSERLLNPETCYRLWKLVNEWSERPRGDPHDFEDAVSAVLLKSGVTPFLRRRIHGKSCVHHEYDIVARAQKKHEAPFLLIECKTGAGLLGKEDVLALYTKAFDIFNLGKRLLEIKMNGRTLKYPFEDVFCSLVCSKPLEKAALFCSLALGILVIQPYRRFEDYLALPPAQVDYYRLRAAKRMDISQEFLNELKSLFNLTFRGLLRTHMTIFNGEIVYKRVEKYHKIVNSLISK